MGYKRLRWDCIGVVGLNLCVCGAMRGGGAMYGDSCAVGVAVE
ncbi:hypothetical protein [Campylobacter lanienae]|nr:hypothetical protein [Campylobacter lanienae]MDD5787031.1 hypothetical protein [Campylobacter lanienae]